MSRIFTQRSAALVAGGLALVLGAMGPAPAFAQQGSTDGIRARPGATAPAKRRCPTCAPATASAARPANPSMRLRGHDRTTNASITLGTVRYQDRVDANCEWRKGAPVGGPRVYYMVLYPSFGRRVGPDEPKWRFDLEIQRGPTDGVYRNFVFSFQDGVNSGSIQVLPGAARYGSGTVRVTPHPPGARFEVQGVSEKGIPLRATIDCVAFETSEAVGG